MIVRIVKMTFREGTTGEFKQIFQDSKKKIREMRGCIFLELLEDLENPKVFMTYSVWSSQHDLDKYRDSELLKLHGRRQKPYLSNLQKYIRCSVLKKPNFDLEIRL